MQEKLTPVEVLISCFTISSFAGLAALLRSGRPLNWRSLIAAFLYSGIFGLIIGACWYNFFDGQDNLYFLIGVSGLAGLGGTSLLDFVVQGVFKGFNIKITTEESKDGDSLHPPRNGTP